jgi:hypothetical protein
VTHPDEVVRLMAEVAREHGYGLVSAEIVGNPQTMHCTPRHIYNVPYAEPRSQEP